MNDDVETVTVVVAHAVHVYSGSVKRTCSECGCEVWVGPRTKVAVDAGIAAPWCESCLIDALHSGDRIGGIIDLGNPEVP